MHTQTAPRAGWFYRSLLSGASATAGMLGAFYSLYYITVLLARYIDPAGRDLNVVHSGFFTSGLAQNSLTAFGHAGVWVGVLAHACIGMVLAMAYGYWAEPRLKGHSWVKGLQFAAPLFLLSIIGFMPAMGIGISAFTIAFSFLLHATYGLVLGGLFGRAGDHRMSSQAADGDFRESKVMERGGARGVLVGAALGLVLAGLLHAGVGSESLSILDYSVGWVYAAAVLFCSSMGFLIGVVTSTPPGHASAA